ncbi:HCc2, partial [Symbiodinium pilosum]
ETGLRHAVLGVRSAAVIAAAKAMEIEQELAIKQTVTDGATHLIELDQRYGVSESASEIACNAGDMVRAAAGAVEQ